MNSHKDANDRRKGEDLWKTLVAAAKESRDQKLAQSQLQQRLQQQMDEQIAIPYDLTEAPPPNSSTGPAAALPTRKGRGRKTKTAPVATAAVTPTQGDAGTGQLPTNAVVSLPATSKKAAGNERTAPSLASGGIPNPTPAYLLQSLAPPIAMPAPRRILVILDLNGTLLYRPSRRLPTKFVERPHARRFLAYCLDTFHLAVWSSARPDNVRHMLSQLLTPEQRKRCVVVWGRDRFGLSSEDYNARVQCYKRLTTVWDSAEVQASHPAADRGARWDQSNTVLVDDSPEKGRSEPHNILPIPEFSGVENEGVAVLPQVHDYLNLLCFQEDISRYMRQTPFVLDATHQLPTSPAESIG
ncbi:phosphoprotein phosphatase [Drechmeria coniospora]|uniref:Mitochondrial import inner membrane translocase subunit TIM50 n=1 Tax=Drechmeria coniospora TaxID=98403 RepID=A0A151GI95_DRECN|nr:phosphoprotein phosphatase [Drechmeria coniospora]KYK56808.1 phosphoprotein phosphatase [Drechmeria coniospora]ODA78369.1 hypothetical protein RJ55_05750 [Drechmeria coniospora]